MQKLRNWGNNKIKEQMNKKKKKKRNGIQKKREKNQR